MGNFYTNITIVGPSQDEILNKLNELGRIAYVSPTIENFTTIYDAECEDQNPDVLAKLSEEISKQFNCVCFGVLNHDDDFLVYQLHENGKLVDGYNSSPDYFNPEAEDLSPPQGGNASILCKALNANSNTDVVESILKSSENEGDTYVFAIERHEALAKALNLPLLSVGSGFMYISRGEEPDGTLLEELRKTKNA